MQKNLIHLSSGRTYERVLCFLLVSLAGSVAAWAQSAPTISAFSGSTSVPANATATFSVVASGDPAPTIQWQRNTSGAASPVWFPIGVGELGYGGVNTTVLTVSGVTAAMDGYQFRAVATNSVSFVASAAGTLNILQAPSFTSAAAAAFSAGTAGSFTVTATGLPTPAMSIVAGSLPTGLTSNSPTPGSLVISGTALTASESATLITVRASAGAAGFAEQTLAISVGGLPSITSQPVNATANPGGSATFVVTAAGIPAPTIRWQRLTAASGVYVDLSNDANFSGVGSATLTLSTISSGFNGDTFRAVVTNAAGSVESTGAVLTVSTSAIFTTLAGKAGESGWADGAGALARLNGPAAVALDANGFLYVADTTNHVIRKVGASGAVVTLAGLAGSPGSTDGIGTAARFSGPSGLTVSSAGVVYVADSYNNVIRVISLDGAVSTLAGQAGASGVADGTGSAARFFSPSGVALGLDGSLYVADTFAHTIRRIQPGGVVSTLAGGPGVAGFVNGSASLARFAYPYGLAVDAAGNVYVADSINNAIRKVTAAGDVSTLAGSSTAGSADGTGAAASFRQPSGIVIESTGNLLVADTGNSTIRRITPAGVVTTVAGSAGQPGSADGIAGSARFREPFGLAVDSSGNVFVADTRNHTLRRSGYSAAATISSHPSFAVATVGGTATFKVVADGAPYPEYFTWLRQPAGTTGFTSLASGGIYSGAGTATLTVSNVTEGMSGDEFRVVVSNLVGAPVTSSPARLTVGTSPVFTSAAIATFRATEAGTFAVAATASPSPLFSATGLPSWASLDSVSGVLSGTPPDTTGSPFTVTITASNGIVTTQAFTLTVQPAILPPTVSTAPASVTVNQGQSTTLSVSVAGTEPFTYQWRRNGVAIEGATGASLALSAVQAAAAGSYTVTITNAAGSVTSAAGVLTVNTAPVITQQPRSVAVLSGSPATLSVAASGSSSFTYQWRKYGVAISGATGASLALAGSAGDAGNYDVQVSNSLGTATSAVAQVSVASAASAPVITLQPASRAVAVGGAVSMEAVAVGVPAPSYQWRKNGAAVAGATNALLSLSSAQAADAGSYDVVITNSAGSVTSSAAALRVVGRSYAGTYFGTFASGQGSLALLVRDDNTGVLLGFISGASVPVIGQSFTVSDSGAFSFAQSSGVSLVVAGTIGGDGAVAGTTGGAASVSFSATRAAASATQGVAGFYKAGAAGSAAAGHMIAGPDGRAYALVTAGSSADGATGTVTAAGLLTVSTGRSVVTANIGADRLVSATVSGAITATLAGGGEAVLGLQRLVNISTRARVGSGDSLAIAGFVISGEESKPVLIRAVGPTLGAAPFNVAGVLAAPRLELFRGTTSLAVNSGIAANRAAIDAAGRQAGAFALDAAGADAAILTTLAPGNYTAQVSGASGAAGIALIEVYDLSTAAAGQKMLNIATRASAGSGDNTLIAGFVVPAGASKRVLVRAVGPGLAPFGVTGVLAQPVLQLQSGSTVVAQNTNWTTSADRDAITAGSSQTGAFALSSGDSALIATLAPGNYTVLVTGSGATSGIALVEVYELP
jgi:sugar lactone lactonase YvrE